MLPVRSTPKQYSGSALGHTRVLLLMNRSKPPRELPTAALVPLLANAQLPQSPVAASKVPSGREPVHTWPLWMSPFSSRLMV